MGEAVEHYAGKARDYVDVSAASLTGFILGGIVGFFVGIVLASILLTIGIGLLLLT